MFLASFLACKDPCPLYKSSETRNHLKPENLETFFLLSALKMPIKSVTSYQAIMMMMMLFFWGFFKHPSTSLKVLAVPYKAVFCAYSTFILIPIAATYFQKPVDIAPNTPATSGMTITFFIPHILVISPLSILYFSIIIVVITIISCRSSNSSFTFSQCRFSFTEHSQITGQQGKEIANSNSSLPLSLAS